MHKDSGISYHGQDSEYEKPSGNFPLFPISDPLNQSLLQSKDCDFFEYHWINSSMIWSIILENQFTPDAGIMGCFLIQESIANASV